MKLKIALTFSVLAFICLAVLYIFQVNLEISERYLVKKYSEETGSLTRENKNLQINSAEVSSLGKITELIEPLGFEKTEKIHYIRVIDAHVVAK